MAFREIDISQIQLDQPQPVGGFREVDISQIQLDQPPAPMVEPLTLGEVATQAFQNIPESAAAFGEAIITPFIEPVETFKGLKSLAKGTFQKLTPGVQPDEASVDALADFFKERYGGIEEIKRTIATDPVGFAADISVVLTAGGTAAARAVPATGKLAKVARAATAVGRVAEPLKALRLTANVIRKAAPKQLAERLFESSAKISTALEPAKRTRIVQAALNEGIVPTKAGLAKTQGLINKYSNKVDDIIESGMKRGRGKAAVIKTDDVLNRLDDIKEFYGNTFLGNEFIDDINKVSENFKAQFGDTINVRQAQEIKRNTQQVLRKSFGDLKSAKVEAGKNIARGIREELENVFPEIGELNQKSRALIELNKELERSVGRLSNRNIFGLTSKIFTAAGLSGQTPGLSLILGLSESVIGNPRVKSRLAIALNKAGTRTTPKDILSKFKAGTARQAAFQTGRIQEETGGQ